jgi:hypothetical protein
LGETQKRPGQGKALRLPGPSLLPSKVPNTRILSFGYNAYIANLEGVVSSNRIGDHARNLLNALTVYRERDDNVGFAMTHQQSEEAYTFRMIVPLSLLHTV